MKKEKTALEQNKELRRSSDAIGCILIVMLIVTLTFGGTILYQRCQRLNKTEIKQ